MELPKELEFEQLSAEEKLSKNEQKRRAKAAQKAAEKEKKAAEAAAAAPQGKKAAAAAPAAGAATKINEEDISPNEYFKLRSEAKKGFFLYFLCFFSPGSTFC